MNIKSIQEYAQIRTKARAYLCYIIGRNVSQTINGANIEGLLSKLDNLTKDIPDYEVVYVLDPNGKQITDNITINQDLVGMGKGDDRSDRAYFYRTVRDHRCTLTDPYPSLFTNEMVVTASFPVYDTDDNLLTIVCVDIKLSNILKMIHLSSVDSLSGNLSKIAYTAFSIALAAVSLLLFIKGVTSFMSFGFNFMAIDINEMFKSTILLTLSLAIFDLVKAIFEEEVLGKEKNRNSGDAHQTMVRFLGSIIIALSIEALMLVFKFALTDPGQLQFAVWLLAGVSMLLVSLSLYMKFSKTDKSNTKQR